jgi:hypothetical protein
MEYIGLNTLRNAYPSTQNYKKKNVNTVQLVGNFPQNFIDFKLPDLGSVEVVEDTSFKFIIELRADEDAEDYIGLYTSPIFYNELLISLDESNPYSIQGAFFQENIITFFINDLTKIYNGFKDLEIELGVKMDRNILYTFDGETEYTELIKYIDFNVSTPNLNEIGTQNVLSVSQLSEYEYAQYVSDSGSFEYLDNTLNEIRLSKLENELSNQNFTIQEIEDYIKNPDEAKLRIPGSAVAKVVGVAGATFLKSVAGPTLKAAVSKLGLGLLLGPIGLAGAAVAAAFSVVLQLIGAKKKKERQEEQIEEHFNKIKSELINLKQRRAVLTDEIEKLKG